jgi:hypothetical protein
MGRECLASILQQLDDRVLARTLDHHAEDLCAAFGGQFILTIIFEMVQALTPFLHYV